MTSPHASPKDSLLSEARWSTFALLWGVAVLTDRIKRGVDLDALTIGVVLGALAVVILPRSRLAFLALSVFHVGWYFRGYDAEAMVHWHIAAVIHLGYLLTVMFHYLRPRRDRILAQQRVTDEFSFLSRAILVAGFFFAGFAKWNTSFFDLELGCGAVYYEWLQELPAVGAWIPMSTWAKTGAVYGAAMLETLGPLLLLHRRSRHVGLILCMLIQLSLGLNPRSHYFEFAGLFFALGVFFLPEAAIDRASRLVKFPSRRWQLVLRSAVPLIMMGALALAHLGDANVALEAVRYTWLLLAGSLFVLLLASVTRRATALPTCSPWRPFSLVVVAFVVNEATPYVGLEHQPTLTMAANIRLTPGASNHLVFRRIPTFEYTRSVKVLRSSVSGLRAGSSYSWPAFVEAMSLRNKGWVKFKTEGKEAEVARANDPRFSGGSLLARVLRLGPQKAGKGPVGCQKPPPGMTSRAWRNHAAGIIRRRSRSESRH